MLPSWLDEWQELFQYVATAQAGFVMGVTIYIFHVYAHDRSRVTAYGRSLHVAMISLSYVLLTVLTLRGVWIGVYGPPFREWIVAMPSLLIAFFLGDYALLEMLSHLKQSLQKDKHGEHSA
jgi:hypothetical protein